MNRYNIKYYSRLALYYVGIAVRGLVLVVFTPISAVSTIVVDAASGWQPSKPLHTTMDNEYANPDNYGI